MDNGRIALKVILPFRIFYNMIKKKPKIPQSVLYSDAFDERKLYNTREEIMNAELKERETGRINWKNFDRLVADARQKIEEEIAASRAERQRKEEEKKMAHSLYVFNLKTNELIGEYVSVSTAALALNLSRKSIESALYNRYGKYMKGNLRFVRKYIQT